MRSRRTVLAGTASVLALGAGCLDDEFGDVSGSTGDDGTDDDGTGDGNESDGETDGGANGGDETDDTSDTSDTDDADEGDGFSSETYAFQHPDVPASPEAALLLDADDADDWLEERGSDDGASEFVEETGFEDAILVALEAEGSDLCHELVLEGIELEEQNGDGDGDGDGDDERLVVEASVSDGQDETQACAEQITAVALLVRVVFEDEPVTELSATIVDQEGRKHERGIGVDTATAETATDE
ncbi:hypothetical protein CHINAEXTREME_16355 [Halobiforma lacisalsi AJ5]|uniref:Lipoprotein n=2 Tax=Natronobacterium lacisalsi TaxID=229731 RepID=M0LFP9_NATLA|nr:hypothetical protein CHINAEXTREME_16355 [Halobiforma lacisalsi AJ5]EMA30815.1 hypothetical protein C445_15951 [Halobiforma lacisalsi AJ5]